MGLNTEEMKRRRGDQLQSEIAKRAGMSTQAYQRIESGKHTNISLETLDAIARALKCEPADLLKKR